MKKLILPILILSFLLLNVSAYIAWCGDDYCTNEDFYNESDTMSVNYCPADCGILTTETWCINIYDLRSSCPICSECSACTTSSISEINLKNWCSTNGYITLSESINISPLDILFGKYHTYIYWLIFLIMGFVIGHFSVKRKKRR
jgi:hypothetical protein